MLASPDHASRTSHPTNTPGKRKTGVLFCTAGEPTCNNRSRSTERRTADAPPSRASSRGACSPLSGSPDATHEAFLHCATTQAGLKIAPVLQTGPAPSKLLCQTEKTANRDTARNDRTDWLACQGKMRRGIAYLLGRAVASTDATGYDPRVDATNGANIDPPRVHRKIIKIKYL